MSTKLNGFFKKLKNTNAFLASLFTVSFFLFLAFGLNGALFHPSDQGTLSLASQKHSAGHVTPGLGKHLAILSVNLESPENFPESNKDSLLLKGSVLLLQPSDSALKFKWILPEGVSIVSGSPEGYLNATLGLVQEVELEVTGFSKEEKRIITLTAETQRNGLAFGATSLISSRPEDSMEYVAPIMREKFERSVLHSRTGESHKRF